MTLTHPLDRVRIVLCRTSHPGNIGAAARAMKTMGLARLVLVMPKSFPHADALARASGAADVLEQATVCASLDEALAGTTFACAMSARRRDLTPEVSDVRGAALDLVRRARSEEVAIVFGTEATGLTIDEVSRCHRLVRIPANPEYSSLNLAASVQVLAYELFAALEAADVRVPQGTGLNPAQHQEVERLIVHLEESMRHTGFLDPARPGRLVQRMRRMLARAQPESEEIAILRGFLHSVMDMRKP